MSDSLGAFSSGGITVEKFKASGVLVRPYIDRQFIDEPPVHRFCNLVAQGRYCHILVPNILNIDPYDRSFQGIWLGATGDMVPVPRVDRNDVQNPWKSDLR